MEKAIIKETYLTVKQLAEIKGCTERYIQSCINKGKIIAIDTPENLENKVNNNNSVYVTVEDPENKIKTTTEKIAEIKKIELIEENEDGTKQYVIEANGDTDLRKIIFEELAKENITIFEMRKADSTLEDAFMKLIEGGNK